MTQASDIESILNDLQNLPHDKKEIVTPKVAQKLHDIIDTLVTFNSMVKEYEEVIVPRITEQISAIDSRSEGAADKILDLGLEISKFVADLPDDKGKELQNHINEIYESCSFQDLVSQHANEIRLTIERLTTDIGYFKQALSISNYKENYSFAEHKDRTKASAEGKFLNGPTTELAKMDEEKS